MSFSGAVRKLMMGGKGYYERAAEAAAAASSKQAVRGRIVEKEFKGLKKMTKEPSKRARIWEHLQTRERGLKKVSFITALQNILKVKG